MAGREHSAAWLAGWRDWSRMPLTERWSHLRATAPTALQTGLAAGIAWFVADDLLGHHSPFFAPIAAVIVLGASAGQRLWRAIELVAGVTLGVLVGSLVIRVIGSGAWQVGLGVSAAMLAAVFLGGGPVVIVQAASTGVLIATFALSTGSLLDSRLIDALIGGGTAVFVIALLLPLSPFTPVRRAFGAELDMIAGRLRGCAAALTARDAAAATAVLDELQAGESDIDSTREALANADETSTLAPAWWHDRKPLARYADTQVHLERAVANAQGLARRAVSALTDSEPVPDDLPDAVRILADAVELLRDELAGGLDPRRARKHATTAAARAGEAYRAGVGFSGGVVVAQIRAIATDLLRAGGLEQASAESVVRRAVG